MQTKFSGATTNIPHNVFCPQVWPTWKWFNFVFMYSSFKVRMMNEILNCIKLIKMYAWEKSFAKAISGMGVAIF